MIFSALSVCLVIFFVTFSGRAVDPHSLISQYGHTTWRVQDGLVPNPTAITQTSDGYIWIGSSQGLFRFDGVKFTQWMPPEGQALPSKIPYKLLGARDGTLWVGTAYGLARIRDGQLYNYATVKRGPGISSITEDEAGTIWVTRYFTVRDKLGPLCRVEGDNLKCFGENEGIKTTYALNLAKDAQGSFWIGSDRLTRWTPGGEVTTYFEENLKHRSAEGIHGVIAHPDGSVLVGFDGTGPNLGLQYFSGGQWKSYVLPGLNGAEIRTGRFFTDRNGALWIGTESEGIYRIFQGAVDHYSMADGLTGNSVDSFHEDVEGNLWVTTDKGLDMFRDTPVLTFSSSEGLIGTDVRSILALKNGQIWAGSSKALNVIESGRISAIEEGKGLPGHGVTAMFEDSGGTTWVGIDDELMIRTGDQFTKIPDRDGKPLTHPGIVSAFTEDTEGNVWALTSAQQQKWWLIRIKERRVQQIISANDLVEKPWIIGADRESGIWIGTADGKIARYRNGAVETISLGSAEKQVFPRDMFIDTDNAVWLVSANGLFRWKDGVTATIDSRNGLPDCSPFFYAVKDDTGSLWVYTNCGLMKITAAELAKWADDPGGPVSFRMLGPFEGAFPSYSESVGTPKAVRSGDGRLWFIGLQFVQMIDPRREHINPVPPPVHIENLVADRTVYKPQEGLRLPALTHTLEIDYTGLSFAVPQEVQFRYKLEGHDADWQDVGTRRQAFYSELPPGNYTFYVTAANNDGVWNETGATFAFSVAPAWYQTLLFKILVVAAVLLIAWLIYLLRVRQISKQMSARFDERLDERTRVARELHDTFLQTVQGSKLVADHALKYKTDNSRLVHAMEQLSRWLEQATEEGRMALNSLRSSTTEKNDLAGSFRRAADDCRRLTGAEISFSVNGAPRDMHPVVRDEIYRIGYEAMRNACAHSQGKHIEILLEYGHDLTFSVTDDGVGIDNEVTQTGKAGHFGLQGMRERAERISGTLTIESSNNSGTTVRLTVPGRIVFHT